jgi:hypothetical protein
MNRESPHGNPLKMEEEQGNISDRAEPTTRKCYA